MKTQRTGKRAEDIALTYLTQQRLKLLDRNFSCRYGEIDLIMQDAGSIIFVEVRFRSHTEFGGALESVDSFKQKKLANTANFYLQRIGKLDSPARFDVIAINKLDRPANSIVWIKNAFDTS